MLGHRQGKGGSNREAGAAKNSRLQSLIGAPSLENGDTGVSQGLVDLRVSQIPVTISSSMSPNCSSIPRNSPAIWLKINKNQTKNLAWDKQLCGSIPVAVKVWGSYKLLLRGLESTSQILMVSDASN